MKQRRYYLMGLLALFILCIQCQPPADPKDPKNDPCEYRDSLRTGTVEPRTVEGGKYPPYTPKEDSLNEEPKPYYVPNGPIRGDLKPANDPIKVVAYDPNGGASQAISFEEYDEIGDAVNPNAVLPEPSVAENGQTVMTTGNVWMSLSLDGGQNFTSVNPTTIFPNDYGGFCCDQVVQYVPQYDLFVWLLQYNTSGGQNAIRIAAQNTAQVRSSNGTSWTYWDFTNNALASSGTLDYNDMSFGRTYLYWTSSIGGGANRYVIRVPLSELAAKTTVHYQFTGSTQAYWSHLTQNGTNAVYWAGHENNSTMKVYSMRDADNFYSWRSVNINSWPNGTMSSTAANGSNWLMDASWKTYVRGATMKGNNAVFAWNASNNGNFPQTHVQIVEINTNTFTLASQYQIWNPDFAFAYPYIETNNENQIGIITAFGGGPYDASSGVGVWGDFVIYYPRLSSLSYTNYGHYHTTRKSGSNGMQWVSAGYTYETGGTIQPYYVRFSH
ncbi:MAG TPA: hypothetical protein PKW08_13370 [Flavobacteriaceae bacterium]|nr:hypothetical protein [Flavobacteriaceae bacterium]MCB9213188.1 hypothetical protein [Alteromonas sp.]HPF10140.1 hypothetical protein [Flavobacteriaceae bacterium]HQU22572.1 hypothetical protein [Flavobacteriaceae bacterium]HQU65777.1 hypothetical protein [Flavobacteriaceae bacterium]